MRLFTGNLLSPLSSKFLLYATDQRALFSSRLSCRRSVNSIPYFRRTCDDAQLVLTRFYILSSLQIHTHEFLITRALNHLFNHKFPYINTIADSFRYRHQLRIITLPTLKSIPSTARPSSSLLALPNRFPQNARLIAQIYILHPEK